MPNLVVKADFLCMVAGHPVENEKEVEEGDEDDGDDDEEDVDGSGGSQP